MLQAAIRNDKWLRVDTWEAEQTSWTRTKLVLDHHYEDIKKRYGEDTELRFLSGEITSFLGKQEFRCTDFGSRLLAADEKGTVRVRGAAEVKQYPPSSG